MTHISALSGLRKGLWGVAISEKKGRSATAGGIVKSTNSPVNERSFGVNGRRNKRHKPTVDT